jgi:Tfp pilus tip-associated adhesin PilY1
MQNTPVNKQNDSNQLKEIIISGSRLLVIYPMIGFYAFMQPMYAYAQYIADIDQITKVEPIIESTLPFYVFQGRTANVTMPLSVEWPITSAAWRLPEVKANVDVKIAGATQTLKDVYFNNGFLPERNYTGYFNPTGCYTYNAAAKIFVYAQKNDNNGACGTNQFAGGALNWAGLTVLDLARYALTGGSRDIDTPKQTVLKRSRVFTWENDVFNKFDSKDPNTFWTITEHTKRFPIKVFDQYGIDGRGAQKTKYARSCGSTLYVSDHKENLLTHEDCKKLNMTDITPYEMRVQVCDAIDADSRPQYCQRYPNGNYKPVGVLQNKSPTSRIGAMGYLNYGKDIVDTLQGFKKNPRMPENVPLATFSNEKNYSNKQAYWLGERIRHLSGGVLRAPNKFLGEGYYNAQLNFGSNPLQEFNPDTGVILKPTSGKYLITSTGAETVANGGPNLIDYVNRFGKNNYVETDDLSELTAEAMRYISNKNAPSQPTTLPQKDLTGDVIGSLTRQPFYFKRVWSTGSDGTSKNLSTQRLNAGQLATVMPMHYDFFPVIENWDWKKTADGNQADEPIRTKCEAQNIPRMIMLSDTNNWHSSIEEDANGMMTSTGLEKDNTLVNNNLKDWLNKVVNKNSAITDDTLSSSKPQYELVYSPENIQQKMKNEGKTQNQVMSEIYLSPKFTHLKQNRYLASAIAASANLGGINYNGLINKDTAQIRVKSTFIDVGEPLIQSLIDPTQTKLRSNKGAANQQPEDCHLFYAGGLGTANTMADFVSQFGGNACQSFLNARDSSNLTAIDSTMPPGYFYPSNPQKLINNIRQAFEIPFDISGNLQVGTLGAVDDNQTSVPLYQFYLDVLQNKRDQTSHLRSLPKKFKIERGANGLKLTEQGTWATNLYTSMRNYTNRTIFVGQEKLDDDVAKNSTFKNFDILTNAATEFAGNSSNSRQQMTEILINFLRGDKANEGSIFRKRSIDASPGVAAEPDSLISSTQNSNPLFLAKTATTGDDLLYITSNDGMLHAIDAETGTIRFSYIPQALAGKIAQTAREGYQNANLFESFLVGGKAYDNNQKLNVLAGGFGLGQKGVFALDVSNIHQSGTQFSKSNVMFEFTDKDDADVGHIIGQPELLTFNTPQNDGTVARQSYLAFTSGYQYDNSTNKKNPYLFLLKISNDANQLGRGVDANQKWLKGSNYFKVEIKDTGANSFNKPLDNGITMPQSLIFNQEIVATYFGDLYGNLWKVSNLGALFSTGKGSPVVTRLYKGLNNISIANGSQLQPITAKPNLTFSKRGGRMITFGTGRLLGINDLGTKNHTEQAIIGIRDNDSTTHIQPRDLAQHMIDDDLTLIEASVEKSKGWRLTLPDQNLGMRSTTTPRIVNGALLFSTQATGEFSVNQCGSNTGGFGVVDVETGKATVLNPQVFTRYNKVIGEILVLPPLEDQNLDNYDEIGGTGAGVSLEDNTRNTNLILGAASANNTTNAPQGAGVITRARSGILSWREIQDNN